jgi:hypothetical protein
MQNVIKILTWLQGDIVIVQCAELFAFISKLQNVSLLSKQYIMKYMQSASFFFFNNNNKNNNNNNNKQTNKQTNKQKPARESNSASMQAKLLQQYATCYLFICDLFKCPVMRESQ